MSKLLVCCESDLPSVNMRGQLFAKGGWEDAGCEEDIVFHSKGDDIILSTSKIHIYADDLDNVAKKYCSSLEAVIFMSKHSSASGTPALTVHPIGNYHENNLGGRERTLVKAAPAMMTDALRRIVSYCDMVSFQKCFEVTHHGPWLKTPTFFIEIGSDDRNWGNVSAAEVLSRVITDCISNDYPNVIGVAGGHYAPRFTEVALECKVNFGHMIPNYQIEGRDDEDVLRMVHDATEATGTKMVYMHRNALKKSEQRHVAEIIETAGYEMIRSADLESINGN